MFNELAPIIVVGIITWGIYRLFELFARRKERMAIIEKLGERFSSQDVEKALNLPLFKEQSSRISSWPLNISLLMIGIGLGSIIAFFIHYGIVFSEEYMRYLSYIKDNSHYSYHSAIEEIIYFSCIAIFGGLGLVVAYLIETKKKRN